MKSSVARRICVSLLARTPEEMRSLAEAAAELGARMVELRLDGLERGRILEGLHLTGDLGLSRVVTIRPEWEGGLYSGSEEERISLLERAAGSADFVDLEYGSVVENGGVVEELREGGCKLILSRHYVSDSPPSEWIRSEAERMARLADIVKIVNKPSNVAEAVQLLSLYSAPWTPGRLVCFSIGEAWSLTRILCVALGSPFTYASLPGRAVAPGQPTFTEALDALEAALRIWRSSP
jgi:3-dehydroquinate dehydratase-1